MPKAFKKNKRNETVPTATTIENVGGTEYGVADYMGRKTYFEKDDNGAFSIPSQDSELNPHLFPGYNAKSGTIDNSQAIQKPDILTPRQERIAGKAFRKEVKFNKGLAANQQYNVGDQEMLRNDQDPNNPQYPSLSFVPFANNMMPGDDAFLASMRDATFAQQNFNQEEIDQNIGNMMRQNGWSYEQAYESVYGTKPTGPVAQKFLDIQSKRQEGLTAGDQQAQINALATRWAPFSGQTIDLVMNSGEATKQITTGTPVNQTVLPTGAAIGMVNGKRQVIMPSAVFQNPEQQSMGGIVPLNYTPKPWRKPTTVITPTSSMVTSMPKGNTIRGGAWRQPIPQQTTPSTQIPEIPSMNNSGQRVSSDVMNPQVTQTTPAPKTYGSWNSLSANDKNYVSLTYIPYDQNGNVDLSGGIPYEKWVSMSPEDRILIYDDYMKGIDMNTRSYMLDKLFFDSKY